MFYADSVGLILVGYSRVKVLSALSRSQSHKLIGNLSSIIMIPKKKYFPGHNCLLCHVPLIYICWYQLEINIITFHKL